MTRTPKRSRISLRSSGLHIRSCSSLGRSLRAVLEQTKPQEAFAGRGDRVLARARRPTQETPRLFTAAVLDPAKLLQDMSRLRMKDRDCPHHALLHLPR